MIVVDAGVLAAALVGRGATGDAARERLVGEDLAAPALIDLETASTFRGLVLGGKLGVEAAERALRSLAAVPIERVPHGALLARCWELRHDLTVYDAAYVALAELLQVPLVTSDARVAAAPGAGCAIELLKARSQGWPGQL